ncbi:MAG: helix-hairpin-helix domain-containing protein [Stagnimonas sp.]|nr:helix-hairpin-helix domain-containing protein [Stagnimonas sp.]
MRTRGFASIARSEAERPAKDGRAGVSKKRVVAPGTAARTEQTELAELRQIPSVGPSLARDLLSLGVRRIADLKQRDPQAMYDALCEQKGQHQDRCVLYTFRCAVYYASTPKPAPEKLKWWNWKDTPGVAEKARKAAARRGLRPAGA